MIHDPQRSDLYEAIIGTERTDYYLKRFASFDEQGGGFYPSWNWAAFFFSAIWVLYRKLYGLFWLLLLIFFLGLSAIDRSFEILGIVVYVACLIGLGAYANAFYYRRTKEIIAEAHAEQPDPQKLLPHLRSRGGVNEVTPALFVIFIAMWLADSFIRDYRDREMAKFRVAEIVASAEAMKHAVAESANKTGVWPSKNEDIGLPAASKGLIPQSLEYRRYIKSVTVSEAGVLDHSIERSRLL